MAIEFLNNVGNEEIFKSLFVILLGIFVGILVKFLINKFAEIFIYPYVRKNSAHQYKRVTSGVNLTGTIIELLIFFIFFLQSLTVFNIYLIQELLEMSLNFIPKFGVAILIIVIGLIISNIYGRKISNLEFKKSEAVAKIFEILFNFATILSALEVINVKLTPFLYLFGSILFAISLSIALAVGISWGLALKPEVSKFINNFKKSH